MTAATTDLNAQAAQTVHHNSAPLSSEELRKIEAYWRACNYLAAGMIYLRDNPLLREPLKQEHIKSRLLGHWGSSPGLSFTYVHLNRLIKKYDLNAIFLAGPGHGAPGVLGPVYLEGTYSEIFPNKSEDIAGNARVLQGVFIPRRDREPLHARKRPAQFMKAENSATAFPMRSERLSTIPICSSLSSSAMARRRPEPWPLPGTPTSFSIPFATARCCRS